MDYWGLPKDLTGMKVCQRSGRGLQGLISLSWHVEIPLGEKKKGWQGQRAKKVKVSHSNFFFQVLDIGAYTGGTSYLWLTLGAHVVAIEEVLKYANTMRFIKDSYGAFNRKPEDEQD